MKNNKNIALSTIALSVLTVISTASNAAPQVELNEANKVVTTTQASMISFAKWQAQQKLNRNNYTDRLIITYKNKNQGEFVPLELTKKTALNLKHVKVLKNNSHVISLGKMHSIKALNKLIEQLRKDPSVESIEPDYKRFLFSQNQPWGISKTQSDQLTDANASNMTVCIIDSGYERINPDLNANNASGSNNSGTGKWYKNGGSHGTHVAGTIAGVNNNEGIVGILPSTNVNLHIVKVFNESGWGYSGDLADAVDTCVNNGAKVINMSLGGSGSSTAEKNALQAATDTGVLLIAASGNDGNTTLSYPASYNSVMAVGALDSNNQHAEFSQYTNKVEISAPGEAILSTVAGDGRLGYITVGSTTYGDDSVVPQTHYIQSAGNFVVSNVNGSADGVLASCTTSGSSYNCSNVYGNICLAERNDNQKGSNYPEIHPAKACADAGASAVIVYSDTARPGLQNPFLVDANTDVTVPIVSVDRALGQQLMSQLGTNANVTVNGSQDYAYYNGTSMATPHVTGVAALVWSNNPNCSADDVRTALKNTAIDLGAAGRDNKTGYGLVQAKAASDALANNCSDITPPTGNTLENGVTKTNLSSSTELNFTMEVPAGATNLSFDMAGGTGDADIYAKFGSAPTTSNNNCRSEAAGNTESCVITTAKTGTYYVKVIAYTAFNGVNLTASFTE
jgi:serine protease